MGAGGGEVQLSCTNYSRERRGVTYYFKPLNSIIPQGLPSPTPLNLKPNSISTFLTLSSGVTGTSRNFIHVECFIMLGCNGRGGVNIVSLL